MAPPPPESKWDRFWGHIKKIHPGVQAAIVAGVFSLIGIWFGYHLQSSGLESKVSSLEENVTKRESVIRDKTAEIQRLETLLTPFRTIALERYAGPEGEALQQLADQIGILQNADKKKSQEINRLETELNKTKFLAEPCKISFLSKAIKKEDKGYRVTLRFKPTKNERLGLLAALPVNSTERILDFWPTKGSTFKSGPDSKKIGENGKSARLMYSLLGFGYPSVDVVVSGPVAIQIQGDNGLETFEVEVKKNAEPEN